MERRKNAPKTRRRSYVRPGLFVCRNPYHSDWGSSSTSAKSDHVRSSVLEVLSAVAGYRVTKICWDCRRLADDRWEVNRHLLYTPSTVGIVKFFSFDRRATKSVDSKDSKVSSSSVCRFAEQDNSMPHHLQQSRVRLKSYRFLTLDMRRMQLGEVLSLST